MSTLDGDGPCAECGTIDNIVWFTDDVLWNNAVRGRGDATGYAAARWGGDPVLCLACFIKVVEERGYRPARWRVIPEYPVARAEPYLCRHGKYLHEHQCDDHLDHVRAVGG